MKIFAKAFRQFDSRNKKFHQLAGNYKYPFTFFFLLYSKKRRRITSNKNWYVNNKLIDVINNSNVGIKYAFENIRATIGHGNKFSIEKIMLSSGSPLHSNSNDGSSPFTKTWRMSSIMVIHSMQFHLADVSYSSLIHPVSHFFHALQMWTQICKTCYGWTGSNL